jgi:hypothetical protein
MQTEISPQQWTNRQYIFVAVLLLLGTVIAFGVVRFSNLRKVYSQPVVVTNPGAANHPDHRSSRR